MKVSKQSMELFGESRFTMPELAWNRSVGANISTIVGLSPWLTRQEYFERLMGRAPKQPQTRAMSRGILFESSVATLYGMMHKGCLILAKNPVTKKRWSVCDPEAPFLGGRPDRLLLSREGDFFGGLELKTTGQAPWTTVPKNYAMQCLFYAGLCGCSPWTLSVLFFRKEEDGKEDLPYMVQNYHLPFDYGLYLTAVNEAKEFWWDHVMKDVAPTPTYENEWFGEKMTEYCEKRVSLIDQKSIQREESFVF